MSASYKNFTNQVKGDGGKSFRQISESADNFSKKADKLALTAGVAAAGTGMAFNSLIKEARELEAVMLKLDMFGGITKGTKDYEKAEAMIKKFGVDSVFTLKEVGDAVTDFLKRGYSLEKAEFLAKAADKFAVISGGEITIAQAANFMISAIDKAGIDINKFSTDGGKQISELSYAFDMMAKSADIAKMDIKDLPILFNSMRQSMQETGSTMKDPKKFAGMLVQAGIAQNLGMQPAEAGQLLAATSRKFAEFARTATLDKLGGGKSRGGQARNILSRIFGTNEELRKWMTDADGNFRDTGEMILEFNQRIDKLGLNNVERQGALGMIFDMLSKQSSANFRSIKVEARDVLYEVDNMGRKTNKVLFDPTAHKNWRKDIKAAVLEGAEAYAYLQLQIQNASGYQDVLYDKVVKGSEYTKKAFEGAIGTMKAVYGKPALEVWDALLNKIGAFATWLTKIGENNPAFAKFVSYGFMAAAGFTALLTVLGVVGSVLGRGFAIMTGGLASLQARLASVTGAETALAANSTATAAALTRQNLLMNTKAATSTRLAYSLQGAAIAETTLAKASAAGMVTTGGFNPGASIPVGVAGKGNILKRMWQGTKGMLKGGGLISAAVSLAPMAVSAMSEIPTAKGLTPDQTAQGATAENIAAVSEQKKQEMLSQLQNHGFTKAQAEAEVAKYSAEHFATAAKNDIEKAKNEWTIAKGLASETSSTASTVFAILGGVVGAAIGFFGGGVGAAPGAMAGMGLGSGLGSFIGAAMDKYNLDWKDIAIGAIPGYGAYHIGKKIMAGPTGSSVTGSDVVGPVQGPVQFKPGDNKVNINLVVPKADEARIAQEVRSGIQSDMANGELNVRINGTSVSSERKGSTAPYVSSSPLSADKAAAFLRGR
jgi:hypothetical protein